MEKKKIKALEDEHTLELNEWRDKLACRKEVLEGIVKMRGLKLFNWEKNMMTVVCLCSGVRGRPRSQTKRKRRKQKTKQRAGKPACSSPSKVFP